MAFFGFGRQRQAAARQTRRSARDVGRSAEIAAFFARIGAKPDDADNLRVTQ